MTYIHKTQNSSYNFKAPNIEADADQKIEVVFPTQEAQTLVAAAAIAVTVKRQVTIIDLGELEADATLNATIGADVERGAMVTVKAKSDTTARSLTFGTGFTAPAITGTISKTKVVSLIFDGTNFIPMAAAVQID